MTDDSILGTFADEIESGAEAPAETPKRRQTSPIAGKTPNIVNPTDERHERDKTFWLDTGHGFEIGFADGIERPKRDHLPVEILATFGSIDDPLSLPRWLFFVELLPTDRPLPVWLIHDPITKESLAPSCGLSADWQKRREQLIGICCERCGRSVFWRDLEGREKCFVCQPRRFKDERDLFADFFRLPGHPNGCDYWSDE